MKTELTNDTLTIFLEGRIDSNNANEIESEILKLLPQKIQIDAGKLTYISSAGLRVLLKVRKLLKTPLPILNVSNEVYEIFNVTGFTELLDVHKKLREISLEGCELLGEGANGKVYRLTRDEMIKVFRPELSLADVEAERETSRKAFLLGVPCAIPFDTVKCGDSYGTIYEILNAKTLTERINNAPKRLPELAKSSALLLKKLHSIEVPEGQLPKASRLLHDTLNKVASDFSPEEIEKMHAIYNSIPEQNHFIHNDYHAKNIMETDGELMLIDLGDAGVGNPLIDLIHCYMVFNLIGLGTHRFSDDEVSFIGITYRELREFWKIFLAEYCADGDKKAESLEAELVPYAQLMYFTQAMSHPLLPLEYHKTYVDKVRTSVLPLFEGKTI